MKVIVLYMYSVKEFSTIDTVKVIGAFHSASAAFHWYHDNGKTKLPRHDGFDILDITFITEEY